jgi:site-specific recombinase XerD
LEFFAATIRNRNTRTAYFRGVKKFLDWCAGRGARELAQIQTLHVAAFIEEEMARHEAQTVKQELAAIRKLFDYLVVKQVVTSNPATSVRGPAYSISRGKTPVLSGEEAKALLESIAIYKDGEEREIDLLGLRDRALIAAMVYSFARVGAVVKMRGEDYYHQGRRSKLRLHEKGGKYHQVPVHHKAAEYLDAYVEAAGIGEEKKLPLFRSIPGKNGSLTLLPLSTVDVLRMIKKRALAAGLPSEVCCHTFRATGITNYLENGGTVEGAQQIAAHASPRTTKLYDRRNDEIDQQEVERIRL